MGQTVDGCDSGAGLDASQHKVKSQVTVSVYCKPLHTKQGVNNCSVVPLICFKSC